jgi:hypothetical protein
MEEGYEQGRAECDDLRHRLAKAEGSRDMLLASSRLREERQAALAAEVWEEGYQAGHEDAWAVQKTYPEPTRNPYRSP